MQILFFIPNLNKTGGVERATISLLNELAKYQGLKIAVLSIEEFDEKRAFFLSPEVTVISLGIKDYKKQYFNIFKRIKTVINEFSADIFITVETASLLFSLLPVISFKRRKVKHIVWEHFNIKNNNGRRFRDFLRYIAAKTADVVVTLTQKDKNNWIKKYSPNAEIVYIYNTNPFSIMHKDYEKHEKVAISVGRYVDVKGFDRLIAAWSLFEQKYAINDWNLIIVGHGPQEEVLQNLINKSNSSSIYLSNGEGNVREFYEKASFYCMSSYSEGLGMVLIEAQFFGLPCIAFDVYAGPSEIISQNSGFLVKDGDLDEYANSIHKLISSLELRLEMSINAQKESKRFDAPVIGEKWKETFNRLFK
ncbi:alpha-1,4-N-acetyl-D-galactosaminyltransferase [compost metagenome]